MTIPTLVEPIPGGYRASTGSPLALTADGPSLEAAMLALQTLLDAKLANGAHLVQLPLPPRSPTTRTTADIDQKTWDSFLESIQEYREQVDREETERLAAEDAAQAASGG